MTLVLAAHPLHGAEGGASHYLPGASGDMLLALPPPTGLSIVNTIWRQSGDLSETVLGGQIEVDLDLDVVLNLVVATYTFAAPVFGASYTISALLPFGPAEITGATKIGDGLSVDASGDRFDLSDPAFVPIQLNWTAGKLSYEFVHTIVAPLGGYDVDRPVNLGRNYWSFDTTVAMTWFDPETGRELSIAPGIMVNTENPDTNYRTGTEFHMDFTATQFLGETVALGPRGYWYRQLTPDRGDGAVLGDFKSESFGIGLGFLWRPSAAGGRLNVLGKWMRDVDARNRFESDYVTVTAAWTF